MLLGRTNGGAVGTLNGRVPLWNECIQYVAARPLLGYGYDAFWDPSHVSHIWRDQGWAMTTAHNGYIEMLLGLGLIGGGAYVLILAVALYKVRATCKRSGSLEGAFAYAALVCICSSFFLESYNRGISLPGFILLVLLARLGFKSVPPSRVNPWRNRGVAS